MPSGVPLRIVTDEINQRIVEQTRHDDKRVRNEGRLTRRELGRLYVSTAVSVLPLADAAYSSGQTVLLECMAAGTPVIVSDVGGVRDYVVADDTALVVPPAAVDRLRAAIGQALGDPAAVQTMAQRARNVVIQRFSARTFDERLATLVGRA
jgi:glycosyltransferase involved in cell wall biosynthesis